MTRAEFIVQGIYKAASLVAQRHNQEYMYKEAVSPGMAMEAILRRAGGGLNAAAVFGGGRVRLPKRLRELEKSHPLAFERARASRVNMFGEGDPAYWYDVARDAPSSSAIRGAQFMGDALLTDRFLNVAKRMAGLPKRAPYNEVPEKVFNKILSRQQKITDKMLKERPGSVAQKRFRDMINEKADWRGLGELETLMRAGMYPKGMARAEFREFPRHFSQGFPPEGPAGLNRVTMRGAAYGPVSNRAAAALGRFLQSVERV